MDNAYKTLRTKKEATFSLPFFSYFPRFISREGLQRIFGYGFVKQQNKCTEVDSALWLSETCLLY